MRVEEATHYPFEEAIQFTLHTEQAVAFPLYLRIPGWCPTATVAVNGKKISVTPQAGNYVRIEREWKDHDAVALPLPMTVSVQRWTANHDSVSVNYGPLTFSLKFGERVERVDSAKTAIGDSSWQKNADPVQWPSFGYYPATPWNYGLVLADTQPELAFTVKKLAWPKDDFPFTPESAPLEMTVLAKPIPQWTVDRYGLCSVLQSSPVRSAEPVETVTLIPMGAARLRITAFPTIGTGPAAHEWVAPLLPRPSLYKASASHVNASDPLEALDDGLAPTASNDHDKPRFTWWDHKGTTEWVQYDFPQPKEVSTVDVYWFDDTGAGECRVPKSWRLLYQDGGDWKPVPGAAPGPVTRDGFNSVAFPALQTSALRVEAELQPGFSGGILAWRVK